MMIFRSKNEKRTIAAALLLSLLTAMVLSPVAASRVYAKADPGLTAGAGFFSHDAETGKYTLTATLTRSGDTVTGLIAESMDNGSVQERSFTSRSGSGEVSFTFENDAVDFRVIAVDKNTLAPICDATNLHSAPDPEDIRKNAATAADIPAAGPEHTAKVVKAVVKDLVLAEETLDTLEALTTETLSVTYEKRETKAEGDDDPETVMVSVTEDLSRYDAITYSDDALTEATARLNAMKQAYDKLQTAAAVLYDLAGENEEQNTEIRTFALRAGEVARAASNAALQIETGFTQKKAYAETGSEVLTDSLNSIRDAASAIRICGGSSALTAGGFGVFANGADLAIVSDDTSSVVILGPDNGKVTQGSVVRADKAGVENGVCTNRVAIFAGDASGILTTPSADTGTFFDAYGSLAEGTGGLLQANVTRYDFTSIQDYWKEAVNVLTDYATQDLDTASIGTINTWEALLSAFLTETDNSDETIGGIAGAGLQGVKDNLDAEATAGYNRMMGYTTEWIGGPDPSESSEARKSFNQCWDVVHCTKDANGNYIGLYEEYFYGIKKYERYYSTPGQGYDGLLYEKVWTIGVNYEHDHELEEASRADDYDPSAFEQYVLPYRETEFLGGLKLTHPSPNTFSSYESVDDPAGDGNRGPGPSPLRGAIPDHFVHEKLYYQTDASGKSYTKGQEKLWKDLYLEFDYDIYDQLIKENPDIYELGADSFDLQFAHEAMILREQKAYDRAGNMTREMYYVGVLPSRLGGTAEYVRDMLYHVSDAVSGTDEARLYVDQYVRWDQVDRGWFNTDFTYIGEYGTDYFAPSYFSSDKVKFQKIPESLRELVAAHAHNEGGRHVNTNYTLGTWEVDEYGERKNFHPWDWDGFNDVVFFTDSAESKELFLCDDDNRIGWRRARVNLENHEITKIDYIEISTLPLQP